MPLVPVITPPATAYSPSLHEAPRSAPSLGKRRVAPVSGRATQRYRQPARSAAEGRCPKLARSIRYLRDRYIRSRVGAADL